jgi:hypothetical protein
MQFSSRRYSERPLALVFTGRTDHKLLQHHYLPQSWTTQSYQVRKALLSSRWWRDQKRGEYLELSQIYVLRPSCSFLAILCGDNGEKVELFAGMYRTASGLSRTFILPDSPRSLELQLQGDDLVEVFLVFSQNVFGLEPVTEPSNVQL